MISDTYRDPAALPSALRFLAGGGEATRLIVERDWTDHPLGEPARWPESLKATLSTVLNSPESMILAWGREELTFFFNETYFPLLGPRLSWAMGARFREVWADGWDQAKPIIDDAFAGRSRRFVDLPWKLGTDRGAENTWWTFSYSRVLDADGEIAGLFIFTNETTGRVLSDAALRESEERLRLVIESARDHVILTTDPGGIVTTWSAGAHAVLGWSADEAIGRSASMIFTDEDRAKGADIREMTGAARDGCANDERWHVRKDGTRVFLNGSMHPLPVDAQGKERGFIKIARDETERRHADQRLALETERQRLSLQQMPGFVAVLAGPEHVFEYVNDAYVALSGDRTLMGRSVRQVFPELAGQGFYELLDGVFATGDAFTGRAVPVELDGEPEPRYLDLLYQPIRNDEGQIVGIFVGGYDVSERVRAERALEHMNSTLEQRIADALRERAQIEEALRQAQKMEAVGQLTGGLAHDFNNLLTGMMGNMELLQARIARGRLDDVDRFIAAAQGAGRRAASLTQRLLAFSRRQTLDPKPTDIGRLIAGMEELLRRTVGPEIHIDVVGTTDAWIAMIDAAQLENALLNLCINARDAMPDGGRLTIATANEWLDERAARERDLSPGQYLSICVTDTGSGMSPETIERAFEPFYTTKPIGSGTGLGLSMVYGFARQSNGQARIYSELGRGTAVCIHLPRHAGDALQPEEAEAIAIAAAASGETILVIDDEATIRHLIDEVLDGLGYSVIGAPDGAAGIKVLQSGARIELLITDVGLPNGMNGRQVADAARALRPGLKVLFITGYAENAAVGNGHLEPGMELLTKPFTMEALAMKVAEMMKTPDAATRTSS